MVWDIVLGAMISSIAGLTLALLTALLTDYREQRRWLQTKVHQPMYSELTNVISGETPWDGNDYASLWADLAYYKTYRVDVELAELLDRYASEIGDLARCEQHDDLRAFVEALPASVCDADGVAELPSGRTIDMETWVQRNALVLASDPSFESAIGGCDPADLAYLWDEVDGIDPAADPAFETGAALAAVSTEFNWGYNGFYNHWDPGWVDDVVAAYREAAAAPDSSIAEVLERRRRVGELASEAKTLIQVRSERGLFRSLWHEMISL